VFIDNIIHWFYKQCHFLYRLSHSTGYLTSESLLLEPGSSSLEPEILSLYLSFLSLFCLIFFLINLLYIRNTMIKIIPRRNKAGSAATTPIINSAQKSTTSSKLSKNACFNLPKYD